MFVLDCRRPPASGHEMSTESPVSWIVRRAETVTFTTLDVVDRPPLSVATAVSGWVPSASRTDTVYGTSLVWPRKAAPSKNATFVTLPSGSEAVAVMETTAGAMKDAPFAGDVRATVGA